MVGTCESKVRDSGTFRACGAPVYDAVRDIAMCLPHWREAIDHCADFTFSLIDINYAIRVDTENGSVAITSNHNVYTVGRRRLRNKRRAS
jgi:hypothetical protein